MKRLGETSPFHQFTNPRCDKSVYFWSWGSYLLYYRCAKAGQLLKEILDTELPRLQHAIQSVAGSETRDCSQVLASCDELNSHYRNLLNCFYQRYHIWAKAQKIKQKMVWIQQRLRLYFISDASAHHNSIISGNLEVHPIIIHPTNYVCGGGGGILFPHPSVRPWHFGFSLISWKGNDGNSSNFADTLISIRWTFIIEN